MKKTRFTPAATIIAVLVGLSSFGTSLTLDDDITVNVPEGETVTYQKLLGNGHTLTKTGAGQLVFDLILNKKAVFDIREGGVRIRQEAPPSVVTDEAVLFLDAEYGLALKEEGGTNFVTRWNDVRSSQTTYYAEGKPSQRDGSALPFLRAPGGPTNTTGRMVVETGPIKQLEPSRAAYFAINESPSFAEAFVVAMDTEDVKTLVDKGKTGSDGRASPFIGMDAGNWLRGNRDVSGINSSIANPVSATQKLLANGSFELDGQTTFGGKTVNCQLPYPDGFHVLNVRPTESLLANYLSSDRGSNSNGGLRYGAVILFANVLSAEQRVDVTDWLMRRWKGFEHRIERVRLASGATFEVDESSQLVVGNLVKDGVLVKNGNWRSDYYGSGEGVSSVDVREGRYDGRVFAPDGTWMHVDASRLDTLTTVEENGTNLIDRWSDAGIGSHYAQSNTDKAPKPFLSSFKLNGVSVVDFGEFWCGADCTAEGRRGGALYWDSKCSGIQDVFTVVMDTEDLKVKNASWVANPDNQANTRGAPFVGNTSAAHFYRGNRDDPTTKNSTVVNGSGNTGTYTCSIDGAAFVDAKYKQYPDGFHILHLKTNRSDSDGDAFTAERTYGRGGQRLAEFLVCNEEVSSGDAAKTINYLQAKWFRSGTNELVLVDVSVAAGAELDFEKLAVTGSLNLDGTLDVTEVGTSTIRVMGDAGCVRGKLKLAAVGTLTVDWPRSMFREFRNREVRLLGFDAVEGDLSGWAVKSPAGVLRGVVLKADGIYATPQPNGLVLTVR